MRSFHARRRGMGGAIALGTMLDPMVLGAAALWPVPRRRSNELEPFGQGRGGKCWRRRDNGRWRWHRTSSSRATEKVRRGWTPSDRARDDGGRSGHRFAFGDEDAEEEAFATQLAEGLMKQHGVRQL